MATKPARAGQRSRPARRGGPKRRTATSTPHRGSRVEPSHITKQKRERRAKVAKRAPKWT